MDRNEKGMSYGEYQRKKKEMAEALVRALEKTDKPLGDEVEKPGMLPKMATYYDRDGSRYPEQIRVSFSDGHTATYELKVEQPHPMIVENIRIIRKWKTGYQAPERRGRR